MVLNERTYRVIRNCIVAVILAGMGMLCYPLLAEKWNAYFTSRAMSDYNDKTAAMTPEEIDTVFAEAELFNQDLKRSPDRFRLPGDLKTRYLDVLDVSGTGIIGMVHIPKINVSVPVYHGNSDAVLQIAAGHMEGTSFPIGDSGSHGVVAAHTGLASAQLFTKLDELVPGDTFSVTILDREFCYEVAQANVTLPEETDLLEIPETDSYCTLLTCTPFGVNSHRLLVEGHFTGVKSVDVSATADENRKVLWQVRILYSGIFAAVVVLCIVIWRRRR